jgi:hypothetical protein
MAERPATIAAKISAGLIPDAQTAPVPVIRILGGGIA